MNGKEQARKDLSIEIFKATGLAVDSDDPVVICALMQSYYMLEAQKKVTSEIEKTTLLALNSIEAAIANTSQAIAIQASQTIITKLSDATASEANQLKNHLSKFVDGLKGKLHTPNVDKDSTDDTTKLSVYGIASALLIVGACGVAVGAYCFAVPAPLSPSQIKDLQIAKELREVMPHLDRRTKESFVHALEIQSKKSKSK